jgi:hypothetical protein
MLYLNTVMQLIKTAVDAIKAVTDLLPNGGALTDLAQASVIGTPAGASIAADIAAIGTNNGAVMKTLTFDNTAGGVQTLFTVTGAVKIRIYAITKTSCAAAGGANIKLGVAGSDDSFIANTDVTKLAGGEIWNDIDPTTKIEMFYDAVFEYVVGDGDDIILTNDAQVDSGAIDFAVEFIALNPTGSVVAA